MRKPTSMKSILNPKPPTVKTPKKKAVKVSKKPPMADMAVMAAMPKRVSIEKAGNGFTISDHMGGKQMVAKSHTEMMRHVKGMMKDSTD